MNMATLPRAKCPYCLQVLPTWRGRRIVDLCGRCQRPIALTPAITKLGARRLWNVFGTIYVVTFPIMGGALVSAAFGDLPPRELVIVVSIMFVIWGIADVWDGYAGYSKQIARSRRTVHHGAAARRTSIFRILTGAMALALAGTGFLI